MVRAITPESPLFQRPPGRQNSGRHTHVLEVHLKSLRWLSAQNRFARALRAPKANGNLLSMPSPELCPQNWTVWHLKNRAECLFPELDDVVSREMDSVMSLKLDSRNTSYEDVEIRKTLFAGTPNDASFAVVQCKEHTESPCLEDA